MSLELPPLVRSGVFFAAFFTPILKWGIFDCMAQGLITVFEILRHHTLIQRSMIKEPVTINVHRKARTSKLLLVKAGAASKSNTR